MGRCFRMAAQQCQRENLGYGAIELRTNVRPQVGGNLSAIELKLNPFDWSHDDTSDGGSVHALSTADGRYDLYGVGIRLFMTAVSVCT